MQSVNYSGDIYAVLNRLKSPMEITKYLEDIVTQFGYTLQEPFKFKQATFKRVWSGNYDILIETNNPKISKNKLDWDGVSKYLEAYSTKHDWHNNDAILKWLYNKSKKNFKEVKGIFSAIEVFYDLFEIVEESIDVGYNEDSDSLSIHAKAIDLKYHSSLAGLGRTYVNLLEEKKKILVEERRVRNEYSSERVPALLISDIEYQIQAEKVRELRELLHSENEKLSSRRKELEESDVHYLERMIKSSLSKKNKSINRMHKRLKDNQILTP